MGQESVCSICKLPIGEDAYGVDQDGKPHHADHFFDALARSLSAGCVIGGFPDYLVDEKCIPPQVEQPAEFSREVKLYLAGPEVFLPNAMEHAQSQRDLCTQYGFIGLHPIDNNVDIENGSDDTAVRIYRGDVRQIRECDIVVANCNPFRGALMDDRTAYELGFGNALGKPSYGYLKNTYTYNQRMIDYGQGFFSHTHNAYIDCQNYLLVDDFGTFINLMMQCGMTEHGGRLIHGSFEDCLKAIREDLNNGILVLHQK